MKKNDKCAQNTFPFTQKCPKTFTENVQVFSGRLSHLPPPSAPADGHRSLHPGPLHQINLGGYQGLILLMMEHISFSLMNSDVINSNIKLSGQSVGQSQYMDVREASASKTKLGKY